MKSFSSILLLFALVCLATATSSKTSASSLRRETNGRNLEFDLGEWASDIWDQVTDGFGFGSDDDGTTLIGGETDNITESQDDILGNIIEWGNDGAWEEWLSSLLNGGFFQGNDEDFTLQNSELDVGDLNFGDTDVCSLVEMAIGMAPSFGVEANCLCNGDFATGLDVNCSFDQCASSNSAVCGKVNLTFSFGGPDGTVDASVCADFANDAFEKSCVSYKLDMTGGSGTPAQTCEATYGGNQCECSIDNTFCLSIDCTPFLPGGKVDTCQMLSMVDAGDLSGFFPDFEAFQPGFGDNEDLPVDVSTPIRPPIQPPFVDGGTDNGAITILASKMESSGSTTSGLANKTTFLAAVSTLLVLPIVIA